MTADPGVSLSLARPLMLALEATINELHEAAREAAHQLSYRPAKAAEVIGVSRRQMNEWVASGEIASFKVGKARLIRREALVAFLDEREAAS